MNCKDAIFSILNDLRTLEIMAEASREDHNGYLEMYDRIAAAVPAMMQHKATIQILPMVVYGWMPTILGKSEWDDSIVELLRRKTGEFSDEEMKTLLHFVNDSFIGVSKLLHFTDPEHWAIWDSNVYAAIAYVVSGEPEEMLSWFCTANYGRVDNQERFSEYQTAIREVSEETGLPIREIEKRVFYFGRNLKKIAKKRKTAVRNHR